MDEIEKIMTERIVEFESQESAMKFIKRMEAEKLLTDLQPFVPIFIYDRRWAIQSSISGGRLCYGDI